MSKYKDEVFIASPEKDKELIDFIEGFGGKVITTPTSREYEIIRPGYRILEAAKKLHLKAGDMVVVVQGDEPFITPDIIDKVIECKKNTTADIVHLITLADKKDYNCPDEIKVVIDQHNYTIYMSRSPIPAMKYAIEEVPVYKQVCIFAFDFVRGLELMKAPICSLEKAEYIEMARALYYGFGIKTVITTEKTKSVDTEEDRVDAEELMKKDEIYKQYSKN
jgi:3-deoxy-manno-octulosonate cytidylyltransferase (CMP-KDO synthetase)